MKRLQRSIKLLQYVLQMVDVVDCFWYRCCGHMAPELMLRGRAWLLKTESEEDVPELQTIISILMNTPTDTLETLYWLEKQSRVHKHAILDAYHRVSVRSGFGTESIEGESVRAQLSTDGRQAVADDSSNFFGRRIQRFGHRTRSCDANSRNLEKFHPKQEKSVCESTIDGAVSLDSRAVHTCSVGDSLALREFISALSNVTN